MADVETTITSHDLMQRLVQPPRLNKDSDSDTQSQWLEVFFDLIFGVAITQLAGLINHTIVLGDVLLFSAVLLPFWWMWMGNVVYGLRFSMDNLLYRFATFLQILTVAAMIVLIPDVARSASPGFAVAYIIGRGILLALYAITWRMETKTRPATQIYLVGFGLGAAVWSVSLFFAPPIRIGLWGVGLLIDLLTPWIGRPTLSRFPVDSARLPQRMGLFVTIVLGQSVFAIVEGAAHVHWQMFAILTAVGVFSITVAIWWSYFSYYELAHPTSRLGSGQPYIYTHLPLILGVALVSAAMPRVIEEGQRGAPSTDVLWLLLGGLALWVVGFWAIQWVSVPPEQRGLIHRVSLSSLAVFATLGVIGRFIPIIVTIAIVVAGQSAIIIIKLRSQQQT